MLLLNKPRPAKIDEFLRAQSVEKFSYDEQGVTRDAPLSVAGFTVDRNRVQLGAGRDAFERAKAAVRSWTMFRMPWVELCWTNAPVVAGTDVAMIAHHFGFWSINPCRIVYTIDEQRDEIDRFGFAYGTLPAHSEIGEERFTVEFHYADESVWYDLYAFSRPGPLARLASPLARRLQKRFAVESKAAMLSAVQSA